MSRQTEHSKMNARILQVLKAIAWDKPVNAFLEKASQYYQDKKALRELAELDSRMLEDIGIDRADVIRITVASKPDEELQHLNLREVKSRNKRSGLNVAGCESPQTPSTACC